MSSGPPFVGPLQNRLGLLLVNYESDYFPYIDARLNPGAALPLCF
jgi:hypothetical protein